MIQNFIPTRIWFNGDENKQIKKCVNERRRMINNGIEEENFNLEYLYENEKGSVSKKGDVKYNGIIQNRIDITYWPKNIELNKVYTILGYGFGDEKGRLEIDFITNYDDPIMYVNPVISWCNSKIVFRFAGKWKIPFFVDTNIRVIRKCDLKFQGSMVYSSKKNQLYYAQAVKPIKIIQKFKAYRNTIFTVSPSFINDSGQIFLECTQTIGVGAPCTPVNNVCEYDNNFTCFINYQDCSMWAYHNGWTFIHEATLMSPKLPESYKIIEPSPYSVIIDKGNTYPSVTVSNCRIEDNRIKASLSVIYSYSNWPVPPIFVVSDVVFHIYIPDNYSIDGWEELI